MHNAVINMGVQTSLRDPALGTRFGHIGFPGGSVVKKSTCQCKRHELNIKPILWHFLLPALSEHACFPRPKEDDPHSEPSFYLSPTWPLCTVVRWFECGPCGQTAGVQTFWHHKQALWFKGTEPELFTPQRPFL